MIFPSITEYRDALRFDGTLKKYCALELVTDTNDQPYFSSGNFSVVFRMIDKFTRKEYAVKCFTRDQERRQKSYKLISKNLNKQHSPYLVHYEYLPDEVWVNSKTAGDGEFPAVVMEWVESKTLGEKLSELCKRNDKSGIFDLACSFDRIGLWLMDQTFAHGDLKTDNILVEPDGSLRLIDYDGMFTPEMTGENARENGSPGFRHPKRSANHFGPHIDDFSILLISLSLHALAEDPTISNQYSFGDAILLDETALNIPGQGKPWENFDKLRSNNEVSQRLVMLYMAAGNPAEMRLFGLTPILKISADKLPVWRFVKELFNVCLDADVSFVSLVKQNGESWIVVNDGPYSYSCKVDANSVPKGIAIEDINEWHLVVVEATRNDIDAKIEAGMKHLRAYPILDGE